MRELVNEKRKLFERYKQHKSLNNRGVYEEKNIVQELGAIYFLESTKFLMGVFGKGLP